VYTHTHIYTYLISPFRRKLLHIKNMERRAVVVIANTPPDPDERELQTGQYK
jgi:hypothetical protein